MILDYSFILFITVLYIIIITNNYLLIKGNITYLKVFRIIYYLTTFDETFNETYFAASSTTDIKISTKISIKMYTSTLWLLSPAMRSFLCDMSSRMSFKISSRSSI